MNYKLTLILLLIVNVIYSQDIELEKHLLKDFPNNLPSYTEESWVYYPDNNKPEKIIAPTIETKLNGYKLYSVDLTNFSEDLGQTICVVLFDLNKGKLLFAKPIWYEGLNVDFFNLLLGKKFDNSSEISSFINELEKVILVGSPYDLIENTNITGSLISFEIRDNRDEKFSRKIEIKMTDNKIINFTSKDSNLNTIDVIK